MKIIEISVIQVRIYAQDTIPYHLLLRPDRVKQLVEQFAFQNHEIPFPLFDPATPKVFNLIAGEFKLDGKLIIIERLMFEDRRLLLKIKGSTAELYSIFVALSSFLGTILDGFSFETSKIILQTDQTECVAELNIDFMSCLSLKYRKFVRKNLPSKVPYKVEAIMPKRISMELSFEQPLEYRNKNISLSPKLFIVEPRANTTLADRVFFTASPCPSDIHIQLLTEFESAFSA